MPANPTLDAKTSATHAAEVLRAAHPNLTWTPWAAPALPAASALPQWSACDYCGTRTPPASSLGRHRDTDAICAVITVCPDCWVCATWNNY